MWHMKGNSSYVLFVPYLAHTHISIKIKIIFLKVVLLLHFDYIKVFFINKKFFYCFIKFMHLRVKKELLFRLLLLNNVLKAFLLYSTQKY